MRRYFLILMVCVAASQAGAQPVSDIDEVRERIYAWCEAWESKNIDTYMSFYSPTFGSGALDYNGWSVKKEKLFQTPGPISLKISDIWVFMDGNHAQARFIQHYQSPARTDIGEKTLYLIKSAGKWKIVSEEWEPLENISSSPADRIVPASPSHSGREAEEAADEPLEFEYQHASIEKTRVRSIQFQLGGERENVFIDLNNFSIPVFFTLEGDKPRIVLDIKRVSFWKGQSKIPVNGKYIQQIRTHLHKNSEKLRVVLDLKPKKDYMVQQIYDMNANVYTIEVRDAEK